MPVDWLPFRSVRLYCFEVAWAPVFHVVFEIPQTLCINPVKNDSLVLDFLTKLG